MPQAAPPESGNVVHTALTGPDQPIAAAPAAILPQQIQMIELARQRARKVNRAAAVATFSGWTTAVFAFFTLLGGVFSVSALALGLALAIIAHVELTGAKALRRFDMNAPRRLALNQIAFAIVLILYCAWSMFDAIHSPSPYASYLATSGELADMLGPIDRLNVMVSVGFYGLVIIGSVFAQGGAALYYITRRRHLSAYLANTPDWVIRTLRAAG